MHRMWSGKGADCSPGPFRLQSTTASADLAFVKDWLGHANIQNTTISARLTTATLDSMARQVFASHRVV